jgi:hypothetical protein
MSQHGPARQWMQNFGESGLHTSPFASGKNDNICSHGYFFNLQSLKLCKPVLVGYVTVKRATTQVLWGLSLSRLVPANQFTGKKRVAEPPFLSALD